MIEKYMLRYENNPLLLLTTDSVQSFFNVLSGIVGCDAVHQRDHVMVPARAPLIQHKINTLCSHMGLQPLLQDLITVVEGALNLSETIDCWKRRKHLKLKPYEPSHLGVYCFKPGSYSLSRRMQSKF